MRTFTSTIKKQIDKIPEGKIFTFQDLTYPNEKARNVTVIISNLAKEKKIVRVDRGAYYKPEKTILKNVTVPVYQDEKLRYLCDKLDGYVTGILAYNQMRLTEQVPMVITIATPYPVRTFKIQNLRIQCVRAYIDAPSKKDEEALYHACILDAIKDIKRVPGATPQNVFDRLIKYHIRNMSAKDVERMLQFALKYPPRVRKILSDMLGVAGFNESKERLESTICSFTYFKLPYKIA